MYEYHMIRGMYFIDYSSMILILVVAVRVIRV